jgi:flagellar motor component MotA
MVVCATCVGVFAMKSGGEVGEFAAPTALAIVVAAVTAASATKLNVEKRRRKDRRISGAARGG